MRRAAGVCAGGLSLAATGVAFDVYALLFAGLALAGLGLVAAVWVGLAASDASVERTLPSDRVQEEEPWPVRLELRGGRVGAPITELRDPLLGSRAIPLTGRRTRAQVNVRFARRGRRRLEPTRAVLRDPLALAVRELAGAPSEVLVLPRVEPVVGLAGGESLGASAGAASRLDATRAEPEIDGLRPYRPGAPASRIHWPTVARAGEMMERRLVAGGDGRPVVALDARRPRSPDALDRAVRAAASVVLHLGRAGGCALVLPGERRPLELDRDLAAWPSLHARLAAVEEHARAPSLEGLGSRDALFWVTAADRAAPEALGRAQAATRFVVTPDADAGSGGGGSGAAFTVAGCTGRRVGRGAVRRAA